MRAPRPCPICGSSDHLRVDCDCPPIPDRRFDFAAYCESCYDGAPMHSESHDVCPQPIGHGATEAEAIADWHESANLYDDSNDESGGWACQQCGRGVVQNHVCPQCGEIS